MDELAKRFADLAVQYGPYALEAARSAVRVEVFSTLVSSIVTASFAIGGAIGGRFLWRLEIDDEFDEPLVHAAGAILLGLATIPAAMFVWAWIDPWTWTALTNPDLWMAHKILKL